MAAGRLNCRITLRQRVTGQDAIGQPVQTWADVAPVWADIRHPGGLETVKADADVSVVKASIRIRHRTGIDAGMQVVHGADIYDIKAVLPDSASKRHLDLVCELVA